MINKNKKKVIKLLNETASSSISLEYVTSNSKIKKNEAVDIFNFLINNKLVIGSINKDGMSITKRTDIDYLDFLQNLNKYIVTKKPKTPAKIGMQVIIGVIIGLIIYLITNYLIK